MECEFVKNIAERAEGKEGGERESTPRDSRETKVHRQVIVGEIGGGS